MYCYLQSLYDELVSKNLKNYSPLPIEPGRPLPFSLSFELMGFIPPTQPRTVNSNAIPPDYIFLLYFNEGLLLVLPG